MIKETSSCLAAALESVECQPEGFARDELMAYTRAWFQEEEYKEYLSSCTPSPYSVPWVSHNTVKLLAEMDDEVACTLLREDWDDEGWFFVVDLLYYNDEYDNE